MSSRVSSKQQVVGVDLHRRILTFAEDPDSWSWQKPLYLHAEHLASTLQKLHNPSNMSKRFQSWVLTSWQLKQSKLAKPTVHSKYHQLSCTALDARLRGMRQRQIIQISWSELSLTLITCNPEKLSDSSSNSDFPLMPFTSLQGWARMQRNKEKKLPWRWTVCGCTWLKVLQTKH